MAKKRKKPEPEETKEGLLDGIAEEVRHSALSLFFFALTIFFLLSPFGKAGIVGNKTYEWLNILLGIGYFILPVLLLLLGISYIKESRPKFATVTTTASFLFFLSSLGIVTLLGTTLFEKEQTGGFLGNIIEKPMVKLFDVWFSFIFLLLFIIVSLLVMFNTRPSRETLFFWKRFKKEQSDENVLSLLEEKLIDEKYIEAQKSLVAEKEEIANSARKQEEPSEKKVVEKDEKNPIKNMFGIGKKPTPSLLDSYVGDTPFVPPPLSLLSRDKGKPEYGDIKANTNIIKRTLLNFSIPVEMDEVSVGPSITRYSLKPAEGVKLSRIVNLQSDLSLALAAHPLRIEAPIPGKALVGIEIPNSIKTTVGLGTILSEEEYQKSDKPLLAGLGKAINGKALFGNIAKMPHVLIAGTTGSGKSVTVHTIINSLLFRNPPENLRFIMVDPKRVELTLYNKIPHLLTPVITDPKKAIVALKWATKEMERRYDVLETEKVRDISSYHKNIFATALKKYQKEKGQKKSGNENTDENPPQKMPEHMPYIVIIIDELADIMTMYPKELEAGIVRLAQMSRAVGIHLILSTQRPSVNVITGLIKANIPARIALQVSSQIDSRTILDTGGAEKLLGAGDMLYLSGEMSKPVRLQSAFISEEEIKKVVRYIIDAHEDRLTDEIDFTLTENETDVIFSSQIDDKDDKDSGDDDELYEEAREIVIRTGKASTSYLQRKFGIGYSRAAKIVDILEDRGVVGPSNGSKAREVYEKPRLKDGEMPEQQYEE